MRPDTVLTGGQGRGPPAGRDGGRGDPEPAAVYWVDLRLPTPDLGL